MAQNDTIFDLITKEYARQQSSLTLIPSENYVSPAVQVAQASCFTNKYAEGYPGRRYYGGTQWCDALETFCQQQARAVFQTDYFVNVQGYSGSPANLAVYFALLEIGDVIMGMNLSAGGHLTHGHRVSASGTIFRAVQYGVDAASHQLDYDAIAALAQEHRPKLIVAGATAYSRAIDFDRLGAIAKSVGAYLLADISHISGLVATDLHPSPFGHADVVMTTTHKMLRGPRGALLFCRDEEIAAKINKAIFPGLQGGPHLHTIAAIAQCLSEALAPAYAKYCRALVANAQAMTDVLTKRGLTVVTGGTDNHLWLMDLRPNNLTGQEAQEMLEGYNIVANKNAIPFDPAGPFKPSGLRLGTPAVTTRGLTVKDCQVLAETIVKIINRQSLSRASLTKLIADHPIPTSGLVTATG